MTARGRGKAVMYDTVLVVQVRTNGNNFSGQGYGFLRKWFIENETNGTRRAGTHHTGAAVKNRQTEHKYP
jgi:hypothetical protein